MTIMPLASVRVLDMTGVWSGPGACRQLAALGAEVIRVESLRHFANISRGREPYPEPETVAAASGLPASYPDKDPGSDPYNRYGPFLVTGIGKRACTMELDQPEGRAAFHRLVALSDVVVENNSLRTAETLGLTWDVLQPVNHRLILVRMTPMGLSGPYAAALGFGIHFEAVAGVTALRGYEDADPARAGVSYHMDDMSAQGVAFAVLAALRARARTGQGQQVEFAQAEYMQQGAGAHFLAAAGGRHTRPIGNRHPAWVQGCYPCRGADQWIVISLAGDRHWDALVAAMGSPEWARDERFATAASRRREQDLLDDRIATFTAGHDKVALFYELQRRGIPAGPVYDDADLYRDPHFAERGFYRPLEHPSAGTHRYPSHHARFSGFEQAWGRPAPLLGQDNRYVYRELLGYDEQTYAELARKGLVGSAY